VAKISVAGIAADEVINSLPEGVAVLSADMSILWSNQCFRDWFGGVDRTGEQFYSVLGHPEIQGAAKCPLDSCSTTGRKFSARVKRENTSGSPTYYHLHAVCLRKDESGRSGVDIESATTSKDKSRIAVTLSDITEEVLQEQKLATMPVRS